MQRKFLVGILICLGAIAVFAAAKAELKPRKKLAYTINFKATDYYEDGRTVESYSESRYVSSKGKWRSLRVFPDGHQMEQVAEIGRGVFTLDHQAKKMFFLSPYSPDVIDPLSYRKSPDFIREEYVAGYLTYVLRQNNGDTSIDFYRAPEFNGEILKITIRRPEIPTKIIEPVSIALGEPSPETLKYTEYPVDYSRDLKKSLRDRIENRRK
jgi:hypothetical protein